MKKNKRPLKFWYDEILYLKWDDNLNITVVRRSNGEKIHDKGAFGWLEAKGLRKTNRCFEYKVQKEADRVMLIKR